MKAKVLLVDDEPQNRALLRARLELEGYACVDADSGSAAVETAATAPIDLVLLDVIMPGMDGFETLRQLKLQASTMGQYLPVLLVTGLDDRESRRAGLAAGADEFLSKPFDPVELSLRCRNLLALRADRIELQRRNARLLELQRLKEEMIALVVHDLKNPTSVVLANLDFALGCIPDGSTPTLVEALDDARDGCQRSLRLLANLLDVARAEESHLEVRRSRVALAKIIAPLVSARQAAAQSRGCRIETRLDAHAMAPVDADLVSRIIENVLDNALRYTPRGGTIALGLQNVDGNVQVRIGNTGDPIPPAARTTIFDKYSRLAVHDERGMNRGLGLYFCRLAVEAHGGFIWVEEEPELRTVFVVSLPTEILQ